MISIGNQVFAVDHVAFLSIPVGDNVSRFNYKVLEHPVKAVITEAITATDSPAFCPTFVTVKVTAMDHWKCSDSINAEGCEPMHVVYRKPIEQLAHYQRYLTNIR